MSLTNSDKTWLKGVANSQEAKFENKIDELEQKFENKLTEFRDNFYTKIDPILKEVQASREDREIGAEQHKRNQDRIESLEKLHPQGKHFQAA